MQAAGRGYLAFARTNPGLFRLMFSGPQLDWDDPPLRIAADAAKQHLSEISAPAAARAGDTSVAGQHRMQTLVWSLLHGYVRLLLDCESAIPGHVPGRPPSIPDLSALLFPDAASEPQIFARQHRRKEA